MTWLDYAEILICLGLYIPLAKQILRHDVTQNFATWFLWVVLDGITTASIFFQHGNFAMSAFYTCGGSIISLCILKTKKFSWKPFEIFVACTAALCIIIWANSGPRNATIASTTAVMISSSMVIRDAYINPWEDSCLTWFGFMVVSILGTIEGKSWSVEERLYPASCTGLCLLLFVLTARKFWIPRPIAKAEQVPINER